MASAGAAAWGRQRAIGAAAKELDLPMRQSPTESLKRSVPAIPLSGATAPPQGQADQAGGLGGVARRRMAPTRDGCDGGMPAATIDLCHRQRDGGGEEAAVGCSS
ncbi:hypothetical protein E2562_006887 [Oryza meyeriana var. granulata]|uniref:DUF834 domain-containing protein n=1 Tax=Oryza meyeriana var. granulata TaxID=110450 RepID=A0A6G1BKM3_9ORYZ|nr:hypothetical protein E2562_006887 [Oryza meyeriana var. granulata]